MMCDDARLCGVLRCLLTAQGRRGGGAQAGAAARAGGPQERAEGEAETAGGGGQEEGLPLGAGAPQEAEEVGGGTRRLIIEHPHTHACCTYFML